MFCFKKLLYRFSWMIEINNINKKAIRLYYYHRLINNLEFQNNEDSISLSFSKDVVDIRLGNVAYVFYILQNNSSSFNLRLYGENGGSTNYLSQVSLFVNLSNILDNEMAFYAKKMLREINLFLDSIFEEIEKNEPELFRKYILNKNKDLIENKKQELLKYYIPKDLKIIYLHDKISSESIEKIEVKSKGKLKV